MTIQKEMKIMDLARMIFDMDKNKVIDFAAGTKEEVEQYGLWCGIRYFNPFDNENLVYVVGFYGGEGNTRLYNISEYDNYIGKFCEKELYYPYGGSFPSDEKFINCIAKMLVDFFDNYGICIPDIVTVETEV